MTVNLPVEAQTGFSGLHSISYNHGGFCVIALRARINFAVAEEVTKVVPQELFLGQTAESAVGDI